MKSGRLISALLVLWISACGTVKLPEQRKEGPSRPGTYRVYGKEYGVLPESRGYLEIGVASWYGRKFHGRLTANGETYDMYALTAAHKTLPLPTMVKVTNLDNGMSTVVRVNDRGPFVDDRLIDLSYQAALAIGLADHGIAPVVVEALDHINYGSSGQATRADTSFYLQLGAFVRREGADQLVARIRAIVGERERVDVSVLQSEVATGTLHKVWLGPFASQERRNQVALLVESAELGQPLRIDVE